MQTTGKKAEWVKPELEKLSVEKTLGGTPAHVPEGLYYNDQFQITVELSS